jgi:hypothetical protein
MRKEKINKHFKNDTSPSGRKLDPNLEHQTVNIQSSRRKEL